MRSIRIPRALLKAAATGLALLAACGTAGDAKQGAATPPAGTQAASPVVTSDAPLAVVYKSPTCGCCNAWVEHMRQSGFRVETHDTSNVDPVKDAGHVPMNGRSCHTARVGQYVIEGHVPADLVKKLLAEHPADVAGLTVPGMVTGSPGMEGPNPQHYDVIAFTRDGQTRVYASR
jgi:hypothetical protein